MFNHKRVILATFSLAASLMCVSAFAADGTDTNTTSPTTPTTMPNPSAPGGDLVANCRFFGGGNDGSDGKAKDTVNWAMNCRAEVTFDRHDHQRMDDDTFTLRCGDGDQDQDDVRFKGKTRSDIDENQTTLRGIRDHDDINSTSMDDDQDGRRNRIRQPVIVIFASDEEVREADGDRLPAAVNFSVDGFNFDIPGTCRVRHSGTPPAPPVPGLN